VHWTRVNAALPSPLVLGAFTLTTLVTAHGNLQTKIEAIEEAEITLDLRREKREQDFGDEPEDTRDRMEQGIDVILRLFRGEFVTDIVIENLPLDGNRDHGGRH